MILAQGRASAEPAGFLTLNKGVTGWESGHEVKPGETFTYTILITCSNTSTDAGCTNAQFSDPLPDGLSLNDGPEDVAISPTGAGTASAAGNTVTIDFTQPLVDPAGSQGIQAGTTIEINIPVKVDDDIPADLDGTDLTNTATVDGSNTTPASDDFIVVPDVPVNLAATTDKSFDPDSAIANPGTKTTMTLTGGNASNVDVDEVVMTDPTNPPGAFDQLALTGDLDATLPEGAEQVQVDCYVNGSWVNGTPAATAALPAGVDPADCQGVRVHFISTDDDGIPPGASGSIDIGLVQRDNVTAGTISNTVSTVVNRGADSSDPKTASDDYVLNTPTIDLTANKVFNPDQVVVGGQSTVTIGATNSSNRTLDSMTITEPSAGTNMFENGLTFTGWGQSIQWPAGATGASVTYTYSDGTTETLDADAPNTLPDPTDGKTVVGFSVKFTGPIVPGASASIPFTVTAADEQAADEVQHPNIIDADSTAPGGYRGHDTASDTLTTIIKRLHVDVDKRIVPNEIPSTPGQIVTVLLSGTLSEFPQSTTDANQIIVQDPADPTDSDWYDAFSPTGVVSTPIPDGATMTVQCYNSATGTWQDVPGMVDLPGPAVFSGAFPDDVAATCDGVRFIYNDPEGFPPGTEVDPNLNFELRPEMNGSDRDDIQNCASSGANNTGGIAADDAVMTPPCPAIDLHPLNPGEGDTVDKAWDAPKSVPERSGQQIGSTIFWSTDGVTGIDSMQIADINQPSAAGLPGSVFDSFDLVRIDNLNNDPLMTYDQVSSVEVYRLSTDSWQVAPNNPCPASCDGVFPGYTVPADIKADVIGFRLTFAESPTRADRINGNPQAPPVGSGVARSFDNSRPIHAVFQLRDELRSDPRSAVTADEVYNVAGQQGLVNNTVRSDTYIDGDLFNTDIAADTVLITPVPVTVQLDKTWTGGPLGVPPVDSATFPDDYPTSRMTLDAHNTTPRKIDRLTITDPDPTSDTRPFDTFNPKDFIEITDPAAIGADDVTVTLTLGGGATQTLTRQQALDATEAQLANVVGYSLVYTGRIDVTAHAVVTTDLRLRQNNRTTAQAVTAPDTIPNAAVTTAEDLVDYDNVDPESTDARDGADMVLNPEGIGLEVTKTIAPASQTEPDNRPITVTLTGQPAGPSRTEWMQLVDDEPLFFNQYDFVGFGTFTFTAPINQVQVDALVGTVELQGGQPTASGTWVNGTPGTALALPAGVSADQVVGLRFTFTRADGQIWENPATPKQIVKLQFQRRAELRTGGEVPTDLAGNTPAPGEDTAGQSTDTVQGENRGADTIGGVPISATDDDDASIMYLHSSNAVEVTKSPSGSRPPDQVIPYTMTFKNTGATPITNPVITDHLPVDAQGPQLILDPDAAPSALYTYALTGAAPNPPNGSAMPTDPGQVTVTTAGDPARNITFSFPDGAVLEVGQTYTITVQMRFRPGLAGGTAVTNTTGITGDRPWDKCSKTLTDDGECQADTTVSPTRGGGLRGVKTVKAVDGELGVLNTTNNPSGCVPDADGFYSGGCVPVTKPGGDEIWRMKFTNTGNLPQDRLYAIDRLPVPGDTGAIVPGQRGSQWRPIPKALRYAGVSGGAVSQVRVYYDTDQNICTGYLDLGGSCPDGAWTLIAAIDNPTVGGQIPLPANATAIMIQTDYDRQMLKPTGWVAAELITTTPAQSPTAGADTIAWNTVAAAGRTDDNGTKGLSPKSEGNKVGVALATGPLKITKEVTGDGAQYAPDTFNLSVECVSVPDNPELSEPVDLGDRANVAIAAGDVVELDDIPWGSTCTVTEDEAAAGNPEFSATTVTIGRDDETIPIVIATNNYPLASLVITKSVEDSAVDADGNPLQYGPFTFTVDCTYLGEPVYATGYSADDPMVATFDSDEWVTFTGLPAQAECLATESDTGGASSTTSEVVQPKSDPPVTGGETIGPLVLEPDGAAGAPANEVHFTNVFPVGSVQITKEVTGDGAELYGGGPFRVHLSCTRENGESTYDGDFVLGGDQPLTVTVNNLYVVSTCQVTETGKGGATVASVSPAEPFQVSADSAETPVLVTVTNEFDVGSLVIDKVIDGPVSDSTEFGFQVECRLEANGALIDVPLQGGGAFTLSKAAGLTKTFDDLPTNAVCTVTETDDGGADASVIDPGQVVIGNGESVQVTATNTFNPPPPPLPQTGTNAQLAWLLAGGGLLVVGAVALLLARRRRQG